MYGKLFDSMYDGTLAGHWQAIVTFQQLIILANADGVVDMTVEAIARRTTIPERIISAGIAFLQLPDQYSRTPGDDGKRIVLLDDHRPWGWRIINHGKYKRLRNMEEKREADRERVAEKRKRINGVAIESQMSQMSPMQYAYADADKAIDHAFASFWSAYPRKVAKQEAVKAWRKLPSPHVDLPKILSAIESAKAGWTDPQFIPHPATWLNGKRWEDEAPQPAKIQVDL